MRVIYLDLSAIPLLSTDLMILFSRWGQDLAGAVDMQGYFSVVLVSRGITSAQNRLL